MINACSEMDLGTMFVLNADIFQRQVMNIPLTFLKRLTSRATHSRFFHATIVIKGGAILSYGYNHDYIHSEIMAVKGLWPSKRIGTTVINLRTTKTGRFGNSKPCQNCEIFLRKNGVRRIYYSNDLGGFSEL